MEGKIHLPKKPAAGAARIGILYRSPPLENVQNFRKGGGSVEKPSDNATIDCERLLSKPVYR